MPSPSRRLLAAPASFCLLLSALFLATALHATNRVIGSGDNFYNQTTIPGALGNDTSAVAAGDYHTLALRADGTVIAWGLNNYGQTNIPADLAPVVSIAAAGNTCFAITNDGVLHVWGEDATTLAPPASLTAITAVAASHTHVIALRTDRTVVGWNQFERTPNDVPLTVLATDVTAIAANNTYSLARKLDGTVLAWGTSNEGAATIPAGLTNVTAIAAGYYHALALKSDGTVVAWGANYAGEKNVPAGLANVIAIAAGNSYSVALKADGTIVTWGDDYYHQTTDIAGLTDVLKITAGYANAFAIRNRSLDTAPAFTTQPANLTVNEGQTAQFTVAATGHPAPTFLWQHKLPASPSWSDLTDGLGYSGTQSATLTIAPTSLDNAGESFRCLATNDEASSTSSVATLTLLLKPLITPTVSTRQLRSAGDTLSLSATATGTGSLSYLWKFNGLPISGATSSSLSRTNFNPLTDTGYYQLLATDSIGTRSCTFFVLPAPAATTGLRAWGTVPTGMPADNSSVVAIATAENRALAIQADGSVTMWGSPYATHAVPAGLTDVVALAVGPYHSLALRSNGTVVGWGSYNYGDVYMPQNLRDVVAIAAGEVHSVALKADGTVVAWGNNADARATPPSGLTDVIAITAGHHHSLALKADGSVIGWGQNYSLQATTPSGLTNLKGIAAGGLYSLAIKSDNKVTGWGQNAASILAPPASVTNVVSLAAAYQHALALRSDGTVIAWGTNNYGEATPPSGLAQVIDVSASIYYSLALTHSPTSVPTITSAPTNTSVFEGVAATFSVVANAIPSASYQWQRRANGWYVWTTLTNDSTVSGATASTLTINTTLAASGDRFRCVVTNNQGTVTSTEATLTVRRSFTTFIRQNFTLSEQSNSALVGPAADPDFDGVSNLLEYALARNPRLVDSTATITTGRSGDYLTLTCNRPSDATDLLYQVEASNDLTTWNDITASIVVLGLTPLSSTVEQLTIREATPTTSRRFLRLRITQL